MVANDKNIFRLNGAGKILTQKSFEEFEIGRIVEDREVEDYGLKYFEELKDTLDKIDLKVLDLINELLFQALEAGKQIFTMGNGGSGSTASHLVCDLNKGVSENSRYRFKATCLNDNVSTILAYANDVSYSDVFVEQLKNFLKPEDVVIAFSGSGNSENVLKAIDYANDNRGITVGFCGFDGGELAKIVRYPLVVPINDMQKCEDVHLILGHLIMQRMNELSRKKNI